ncbi:hypothetical protein J7J00_24725 [Bacillus sp. ISL-4]|uniref:hypothetical protein n=1 Tax=Bacillus sp. ISL-4 TaxID=2819125 RepID=UPI001BE7F9EE|nr:hypothetical protein [Bacillus sp. ISL-4]MBT2668638.1 hypothetical protein [Bacillus sp. ISL-4]MBT2673388.1 hypothetical protein [Streptomyces sp. ISL-14]
MKKRMLLIGGVLFALIAFYVSSLQNQLAEATSLKQSYQDEIKKLSTFKEDEAKKANKAFLQYFFNYENVKERNKQIKPYMTDQAFQAVDYKGESEAEVHVSASNLKSYEYRENKTSAEYITELDMKINVEGNSSKEQTMIKTELIFVEGEGWKVDHVEMIYGPVENHEGLTD